jgi:hypothetical protein
VSFIGDVGADKISVDQTGRDGKDRDMFGLELPPLVSQ